MAKKLCIDCKFHIEDNGYYCTHPKVQQVNIDYVLGNDEYVDMLCFMARESSQYCEPLGFYWEEKEGVVHE